MLGRLYSTCRQPHRPGPHHPESPERLEAVLHALKAPEFAAAVWRDAPLGSFEQVTDTMLPAQREFAPELLIISAGFDVHHLDPLGRLKFTDEDCHWITRELMEVADETAGGRVVCAGRGLQPGRAGQWHGGACARADGGMRA